MQVTPEVPQMARANRASLGQAVRFCLAQGNRQEAEPGTQGRTALLPEGAAEFD